LKGKKITSYADEYTTISYYLENEYGKTERTVNIPVVDTGYGDKLNLSAYFHGDSFTAEPSDNYTTYTTDTDGAQLDFINQLVSTDFSLIFTVGKANFKNVDIYLIDCNDENVYLKLTYTKNGTDGSLFRLNDGESFVATADFYSVAVDKFTVNYDNATQKIVYTTGSSLTVATDGAGNPFYGFSGSTFYLSIRLTEVSGRSSINIYSVNKQKINTSKVDLIEPAILAKNASGERSLNDTFTIAGCVAVDVLDPNVTFTFDVTSPSGEYVRSEEGTLLDGSASPENTYVVKLTQRGVYTVTYTATDTTGRETVYSYIVRVVDMQTPTARLTGSYQTTAKVGDTVTIADIEYADDISERGKMTVFVCAILPDNSSRAVKNNTFTAEQKGKYTVWYMVSDENGNAVFVSYTITVS
jgi:hypothetical protein